MTRQPCAACQAPILRRTGLALCRECSASAWQAFEASVKGYHPDTRQRAWSAFYGGRSAPAISAAKTARAVMA